MARLLRCPIAMVVAAFFAIYVLWGSTYIGIAIAVKTIPPFLMSSARFLLAGLVLYAICRIAKAPRPTLRDWLSSSLLGFMLIFGGNAGATWALQHIPSGSAALLVATEPLWLVLLAWVMGYERRPSWRVVLGLLIGLAGMAVLVGPGATFVYGPTQIAAVAVVLFGAFIWALGSILSIRVRTRTSPFMTSAMMLVTGGAMFGVAGFATGEARAFDVAQVTWPAVAATAYLAVFGSIVALSAYVWLLRRCSSHRVATYAFVNPVVAVILGAVMADEAVNYGTLIAGGAIVVSVALLISKSALVEKAEPVEDAVETPELEPALQAS
jgi:drug/metabolite transporter (DMT)-like permease